MLVEWLLQMWAKQLYISTAQIISNIVLTKPALEILFLTLITLHLASENLNMICGKPCTMMHT